jgi:Flp pilus assembly protein TadD
MPLGRFRESRGNQALERARVRRLLRDRTTKRRAMRNRLRIRARSRRPALSAREPVRYPRGVRLGFVALLLTAGASHAQAQVGADPQARGSDAQARVLFDEGRAAFEAGRYEDAERAFRHAHELSPRPELLYNLALALDRLRRDEETLTAFRAYIEADPTSPHRPSVEARIAALERVVAARAREEEERDSGSLWWLWAGLGAFAVGAAIVIAIVATSGDDFEQRPPVPGDDGLIVEALWSP